MKRFPRALGGPWFRAPFPLLDGGVGRGSPLGGGGGGALLEPPFD